MKSIKLTPLANIYYQEWLLHPDSTRYHLSFDQILEGQLLSEKLDFALKRFVHEHLVFNSHVYADKGILYWERNKKIQPLDFIKEPIDRNAVLAYIAQPFNLHKGPLYRYRLIRVSATAYRFIVVFHHILIDGTMFRTGLIEEITRYYNNPYYTVNYSLTEQAKRLRSLEKRLSSNFEQSRKQHRLFWKKNLANVESLDLKFLTWSNPLGKNNSNIDYGIINEDRFYFNNTVTEQLKQLKGDYLISAYVYSLSIFAITLYRYTEKTNFAISYPISLKKEHHSINGAQININIIPCKINPNSTVLEILRHNAEFIRSTTDETETHCYYPIGNIIQDNHCNSLLNVYFAETCFRDHPFRFDGISDNKFISGTDMDGVSGEMILFEQEKKADKFHFRMRYDKQYYNEKLIKTFVRCYKNLFTSILSDLVNQHVTKNVIDYPLEKRNISNQLLQITKSTTHTINYQTIHQAFEIQVLAMPNRFAIVSDDVKITYRELNQKTNQLARYLMNTVGDCSRKHIGICFERNEWIIISILAILKTGGIYVPLDPNAPNKHNNTILLDSKPITILTHSKLRSKIDMMIQEMSELSVGSGFFNEKAIISLDYCEFRKKISRYSNTNIDLPVDADSLAYIIYTSGTTGKPKGVPQRHGAILSLFRAAQKNFKFTSEDVWVLFHSYVFDFSIWEMWGALLHGGMLVLPTDNQVRDPKLFYQLCYAYKITVLNQTPSAFYPFIIKAKRAYEKRKLISLRYVIIAGEKLNVSHLAVWFELYGFNKPRLFNGYGLTETTILTTFIQLKPPCMTSVDSIGYPLDGQLLVILDPRKALLPCGAIGEIYIIGIRLSPGYLNNIKLTNEKFVKLTFGSANMPLSGFKTGDLGRQLPNGAIEFLGRSDSQVKISGYRIELHAIEEIMLEIPDVSSAIVIAKKINESHEQKHLIAYYVSEDQLDETALQHHLVNCLPFYMQPKKFIRLKKIPLTINGKLATNELPGSVFKDVHSHYVSAYDNKSELICTAFSNVLNIEKIGMNDNFFHLGGDSLAAITLASKLQHHFKMGISDIFNYQTPAQLVKNVVCGKNILKSRLEKVKLAYTNASHYAIEPPRVTELQATKEDLLRKRDQLACDTEKNITTVLLTGATGFLGCNLLYQLLNHTDHDLFLLVRSAIKAEAFNRIQDKFTLYFDRKLKSHELSRITVFRSDIEEPSLGLAKKDYCNLCDKVDTIIHAAALVKHYGDEKIFYRANVHATVNLLDLAHKMKGGIFHFISTYSVLNFGYTTGHHKNTPLSEEDIPTDINHYYNVYSKTKLQAELAVVDARKKGLNTNIYRMGNLAFMEKNGKAQENIDENSFYQMLRFFSNIHRIPDVLDEVEITPVDLAAEAVVQLFNKNISNNNVYHIFNPGFLSLSNMFAKSDHLPQLKKEKISPFIDYMIDKLYTEADNNILNRFLCRQGWLEYKGENYVINPRVSQAKTEAILESLGFIWKPISLYVFNRYVSQLRLC